jgi:CBS domain-containing protein
MPPGHRRTVAADSSNASVSLFNLNFRRHAMKVKDVMTPIVVTCPSSAPAAYAARIMWEQDCGIVPVTDPDTGDLCGVVTDRDLCMAALTQGISLHDMPLARCLVPKVHHCREDQNLSVVHGLMRKHRIRRIPVVDIDSKIVGMVSLNDLACRSHNAKTAAQKALAKETLATFCAISEHWSEAPPEAEAGAAAEA